DVEGTASAAGFHHNVGLRGPELGRPPAHLFIAPPVEIPGYLGGRGDFDGPFGRGAVRDRFLEVDDDRLGDADLFAFGGVDGRGCEVRLRRGGFGFGDTAGRTCGEAG